MIRGYHIHLYYTDDSRQSAAAIRERLVEQEIAVTVGPMRDLPVGPHPIGQFLATVDAARLEPALRWFMWNRGSHLALLHPNSGDEVLDHSARAVWLGGEPLSLDHSKLDSAAAR